jgi:hypothetical protein
VAKKSKKKMEKTKKQVGKLIGRNSPLNPEQKSNLIKELKSGKVKVKNSHKKGCA